MTLVAIKAFIETDCESQLETLRAAETPFQVMDLYIEYD
jgi:hypothetical protein